jgi:integrase
LPILDPAKVRVAALQKDPAKVMGRDDLPTVANYVGKFSNLIWGKCSASTVRQNLAAVRNWIVPYLGHLRVHEVRKVVLGDFVTSLKQRNDSDGQPDPLGNASINFALRRVREILNNARDRFEGVANFKTPKIVFELENQLRNELSADEQAAFLGTFDDFEGFARYLADRSKKGRILSFDDRKSNNRMGLNFRPDGDAAQYYFARFQRTKALFVGFLHTGLRKSDLLDLRWSSVRFDEGLITVMMKKTKKPAIIPISLTLGQVLAAERDRPLAAVTDHVFLTPDGKPYAEVVVRRYFEIAKSLAGITRRVRIHDLRHSFASNLASQGFSPLVLRDLLGHTTTKQTERYARPNAMILDSVRAALDRSSDKSVTVDTLVDTAPQKH